MEQPAQNQTHGAARTGGDGAGPPAAALPMRRSMAHIVAAGILLSRIAGLVRESIFAHYLGNSAAADAFKAGFRIPNILQNLFGEGVLSASFIPVYSKLLEHDDRARADQLAWTVGSLLSLAVAVLVLLGVFAAPYLIMVIAPGFEGAKRELTVTLVRILFPCTGLLVMSAWCLGVLNSHHRFFASYSAPVAWNVAIIATLLWFGPRVGESSLVIAVAWGAVAGAALQIGVQLPQTIALLRNFRVAFAEIAQPLGAVGQNLLPVVAGRGVVQLSGYIDNLLASLLPTGAVAALSYGQILYMLPLSLFAMSVAAAELPTMSRAAGSPDEIAAALKPRLDAGLRQIAFLVVPSAAAFVFLGDTICALLFQSGQFTRADSLYVWSVLAGSSIGLLAAAMGRLYNSAFYSLHDTRTPFRLATLRVGLTLILGYVFAIIAPPLLGIPMRWGVAGLTASAGLAGWLEFSMLRTRLNRRIGGTGLRRAYVAKLWGLALAAGVAAFAVKRLVAGAPPTIEAIAVLPVFALIYFAGAYFAGVAELRQVASSLSRRIWPSANAR
ncbi:MAG: murein biosynthesis integral membrane protein MurJ [Candidatus Binataceae bacterium]